MKVPGTDFRSKKPLVGEKEIFRGSLKGPWTKPARSKNSLQVKDGIPIRENLAWKRLFSVQSRLTILWNTIHHQANQVKSAKKENKGPDGIKRHI